jgi:hypothetical protein
VEHGWREPVASAAVHSWARPCSTSSNRKGSAGVWSNLDVIRYEGLLLSPEAFAETARKVKYWKAPP